MDPSKIPTQPGQMQRESSSGQAMTNAMLQLDDAIAQWVADNGVNAENVANYAVAVQFEANGHSYKLFRTNADGGVVLVSRLSVSYTVDNPQSN